MLPSVVEAEEHHEGLVRDFFSTNKVPFPEKIMERAFAEQGAATPWICLYGGRIVGFVLARRSQLEFEFDRPPCSVFSCFLLAPDIHGEQAARLLLQVLPLRLGLCLAGGWGSAAVKALRSYQWRYTGAFDRLKLSAQAIPLKTTRSAPAIPPTGFVRFMNSDERRAAEEAVAAESARTLSLEDGTSAVLRPSLNANEWVLTRYRGKTEQCPAMVERIRRFCGEEKVSVYTSMRDRWLTTALINQGAEKLTPRWGLFVTAGKSDFDHVVRRLDSQSPWRLYAADCDADIQANQ